MDIPHSGIPHACNDATFLIFSLRPFWSSVLPNSPYISALSLPVAPHQAQFIWFVPYHIHFCMLFNSPEKFHVRCPKSLLFLPLLMSVFYSHMALQGKPIPSIIRLISNFISKYLYKRTTHGLIFVSFINNIFVILICDITSKVLKVKNLFQGFISWN